MIHSSRVALATAFLASAAFVVIAKTAMVEPAPQLPLGSAAPAFALPNTADGKTVALADFKGKVKGLCVVFSCNHCPVARAYEDRVIALGREYREKGIPFVLISSNDAAANPADGPADMKMRAGEKNYPFPYLYDESQEVGRAFGARVTPHVYLFDKDLVLRYRGAVDDDEDEPRIAYLKSALDLVLAGSSSKIDPAETIAKGCSIKWK